MLGKPDRLSRLGEAPSVTLVTVLISLSVLVSVLWRTQWLESKKRRSADALSIPSLPLFLAAKETATGLPDKIAIIDKTKEQCFTYRQLLSDVAKFKQTLLKQLNLETVPDLCEKRIAYLVPNGYDYVVAQWAIWAAGGICVPLCTTHPLKELLYTIGDSQPSLIMVHENFHTFALPLREHTGTPIMVMNQFNKCDSPLSLDLPRFDASCRLSKKALMIYTSGTTSNPKGCVSTHGMITFQSECLVKAWKYTPSDHLIHVLPLHHVHGIINGLTASLLSGATVEMYAKFDAKKVWERWQDVGSSTMFMGVPTIYSNLVEHFDTHIRGSSDEIAARSGAGALRLTISGSAALPTPLKAKFAEISGQVLLERYGMTEIGMALSCDLEVDKRPDGSVGWPLPGVGVRLVDPQDSTKIIEAPDEDGMIEIKGDNVFLEYWNKPEATAKEFTPDGWFKTGDVARRSQDGAYFIQGRASVDVIKSGGYKISALEVERKILCINEIKEVAVVGVLDEKWGQRVAAVIMQRPGTPSIELSDLRKRLKEEMAPYKIPSLLQIVDKIERNAMGKVNKKTLAAKYWPARALEN